MKSKDPNNAVRWHHFAHMCLTNGAFVVQLESLYYHGEVESCKYAFHRVPLDVCFYQALRKKLEKACNYSEGNSTSYYLDDDIWTYDSLNEKFASEQVYIKPQSF